MRLSHFIAEKFRDLHKRNPSLTQSRPEDPADPGDLVIDEEQFDRIESLVFQKLGREGSSRAAFDEFAVPSVERITDDELAALVYGPEEPNFEEERTPALTTGAVAKTNTKRRIVAASVAMIIFSVTALSSHLPFKHQVESARLALSFSEIAKAGKLISIAEDRLSYISKVGRDTKATLLAGIEMTSAASASLEILNRLPVTPRRDTAVGTLFGVMTSAGHHLRAIEGSARPENKLHWAAIVRGTAMIAIQARIILSYGESFVVAPDFPLSMPGTSSTSSSSASKRSSRRPARSQPVGSAATTAQQGTTDQGGQQATPPSEDCQLGQGAICITVPNIPDL